MSGTSFASDTTSGTHPRVLEAVAQAMTGHAPAYGDDPWTTRAHDRLRDLFGSVAEPFLVTTGTAANTLALAQVMRPYNAVLCPATAHVSVDECGAPARFAGITVVPIPTADGKLRPDDVVARLGSLGDAHRVQPRVVSISQATERGTVYSTDEIAALAATAHAHGLLVHVDGARLANAAASLGSTPKAFTTDAGVDLVTVGLTKTGAMLAEAILFLRPELADGFAFVRKQAMQLAPKLRLVGAQVDALLRDDLWLELAAHANAMARALADRVAGLLEIAHPVEANAVFVRVPDGRRDALADAGALHAWDDGLVRWMTAWDTTLDEVEAFAGRVRAALA
ncbi:MAG: threonine aldolase family protein [Gaiella sp.]